MADGCGAAAEVARTLLGTETTRRIDKDTALTIIDGLVEPLRKKATECVVWKREHTSEYRSLCRALASMQKAQGCLPVFGYSTEIMVINNLTTKEMTALRVAAYCLVWLWVLCGSGSIQGQKVTPGSYVCIVCDTNKGPQESMAPACLSLLTFCTCQRWIPVVAVAKH